MKNVKFSFSKCGIELGSHNLRHMLAGSNDIFLGTENLILHTVIASLYLLHKTEMCQVFVPCSLAHWIPRTHNDAVRHKNKPCNLNNYVSIVSKKPKLHRHCIHKGTSLLRAISSNQTLQKEIKFGF